MYRGPIVQCQVAGRRQRAALKVTVAPVGGLVVRLAHARRPGSLGPLIADIAGSHGGVPNAVFRGEPFFGQDRVEMLFWRLQQNGLTTRPEPRPPFVARPKPVRTASMSMPATGFEYPSTSSTTFRATTHLSEA